MKIKQLPIWLISLLTLSSASFAVAQTEPAQQPPERIISAGSAVTEILLALGAENELVGVDITSELPDGVHLPKVGYHRQLSAEGLISLNPTMIMGSKEMGPTTALNQVKATGIQVAIVNSDSTPDSLLQRIDQIATLTHTEAHANALKHKVQQQIDTLASNQPQDGAHKKVLFLLLNGSRGASVAGRDTTPDAIISLAGGVNPAASQLTSYKPLSQEAMVEMQPDVILVSGRSFNPVGGADKVLQMMPLLAATPAGKNKAIVALDPHALIGGLGLASMHEAQRINQLLYP